MRAYEIGAHYQVATRRARTKMGTADTLAVGAVIVAILIAVGIMNKTVDAIQGGAIIVALVGAAGVAQVIKSQRSYK